VWLNVSTQHKKIVDIRGCVWVMEVKEAWKAAIILVSE
jgi:hypothetical protein